MESSQERILGIAALVHALALTAFGCTSSPPSPPFCDVDAGWTADTGVLACDAPASVDPSSVDDMSSFRSAASALVCDIAIRCGLTLSLGPAQSYCHPRFAELQARRDGVDPSAPYDAAGGRACLSALREARSCDAAALVAFVCRDIADGLVQGACATDDDCDDWQLCRDGHCTWLYEGDACTGEECAPGLTCVDGRCWRAAAGCTCGSDNECGDGLRCADGRCRFGRLGESCGDLFCSDGLVCDNSSGTCVRGAAPGESCAGRACAAGICGEASVCVEQHHLGCACTSDDECPWDVARCVGGVCTPRPMEGDVCDPAGAPCFGSICDSGTCRREREGEGPCSHHLDCEDGLRCSAANFQPGLCGAPRAEGQPCGPTLAGGCGEGLYCDTSSTAVCTRDAQIGERCTLFGRPCVEGASCNLDTHLCE